MCARKPSQSAGNKHYQRYKELDVKLHTCVECCDERYACISAVLQSTTKAIRRRFRRALLPCLCLGGTCVYNFEDYSHRVYKSQMAQVLCRYKHTSDVNSPSLLFYDRLRHSISIWQTSRHHMEATEPRLLYYAGSDAVSSRMIYCHIAPAVHLHRCDVTNLESSSPCQSAEGSAM